jgi:acyl-CoA thioester hydrolase
MTDTAVFEQTFAVPAEDIDMLGHVGNITYVRWVQDIAIAHWRSLTSPEEQASLFWVVLRHEIDYLHPALRDDTVTLRTWVGTAEGLSFERHTEIVRARDEKLLARARTLWCPVDAATRRPRRPDAAIRERFSAGRGPHTA